MVENHAGGKPELAGLSPYEEEVASLVRERMSGFHEKARAIVMPLVDYPDITADIRFDCYPVLFLNAFQNVSDRQVKQLSLAFRLGWEYVSVSDAIFDSMSGMTPSNTVCSQVFYDGFVRELHGVFPAGSAFWQRYEDHLAMFLRSVLTEMIRIRHGLGEYAFEEFGYCSANKIAFGKMVIAALEALDGSRVDTSPLTRSHDHFYIAAQLRDDLMDWLEDHAEKRHSFLIRHALSLHGIGPDDYIRKWPTQGEMRKMVYRSGTARWALDKSKEYFGIALREASHFDVPVWKRTVGDFLKSLDGLYSDLDARSSGDSKY